MSCGLVNPLSFLGSLADSLFWAALLGLCHLETMQGGSRQGGGKVAVGQCGQCVCLIKYPDKHQALPGLHLRPTPAPPTRPTPITVQTTFCKESLVGSHPFQVQALRSVTSPSLLGLATSVCLYISDLRFTSSGPQLLNKSSLLGILSFYFNDFLKLRNKYRLSAESSIESRKKLKVRKRNYL